MKRIIPKSSGGTVFCRILVSLVIFTFFISMNMSGQVNMEKHLRKTTDDYLGAKFGFAMALYKGNTDLISLDMDARLDYKKGKNEAFFMGNLAYGKNNDETYLNRGFAHLRGSREIFKRISLEAFVQDEFNHFIRLQQRILFGGGVRLKLLETQKEKNKFSLYTGFGLMYEKERFKESEDYILKEDTSMLKSTNYLSVEYKSEKFSLGNVTYLQFHVGEEDSTRINSDLNFSIQLSKLLSYRVSVNYRYDSVPAPGVKDYDLQIKNGLTIVFD